MTKRPMGCPDLDPNWPDAGGRPRGPVLCVLYPHCTCGQVDADCVRCFTEAGGTIRSRMILCPTCGNKRCPKASDHRLECTGSNEPGQKGSIYE